MQFLEFVVECFDAPAPAPTQVCFEITESAVIANLDHARRFVGVLHGMGCQFALDDFGCGVGSFSNLKNLPLDYLKIDGSFMRNLARDTVNQAMVTAMIKLARTLNFKVIAEQVEDERRGRGGAPDGRRLPAGLRDRPAAAAAAGGLDFARERGREGARVASPPSRCSRAQVLPEKREHVGLPGRYLTMDEVMALCGRVAHGRVDHDPVRRPAESVHLRPQLFSGPREKSFAAEMRNTAADMRSTAAVSWARNCGERSQL